MGWSVQETPSAVRLILPGAGEAAVGAVLGEEVDSEEPETPEASFGLEFQLRDFIAQNIGAIDVQGPNSEVQDEGSATLRGQG